MATATLRSGTMPGERNPLGALSGERRTGLIDVREVRLAPAKCELRALRNGDLVATGYASTFDEYEVYGGPENYGWIEKLDRKAFNATLRDKPDVVYLVNHTGLPLARTKSGTLELKADDGGLRVQALLEPTDPDVQAIQPKMARGDLDEMSFAFFVKRQAWSAAEGYEDDPYSYRLIQEVSLHRGDVSVVTFGANPNTTASLGVVSNGSLGQPPVGDERTASREQLQHVERALKEGATVFIDWQGKAAREVINPADDGKGASGSGSDSATDTTDTSTGDVPAADQAPGATPVEPGVGVGAPATGDTSTVDEARLAAAAAGTPVPLAPVPEPKLPEGETIPLAEAKAFAGLALSVDGARAEQHPPEPEPEPGSMSLADARAKLA